MREPRWLDVKVEFADEPKASRFSWLSRTPHARTNRGAQDQLRTAVITIDGRRHEARYRPGTSDKKVIEQIVIERDYDLCASTRYGDISDFLNRQRQQGLRPLIVDAGANIGISALYFSLVFEDAVVVAIEPEPGNFELLQKNVAGRDVHCVQAALASSDGVARVFDPGEGAWGYRAERDAAGDVPCISLDTVYQQFGRADLFPFLVKIDIEGGEEDVFGGNTAWLADTPLLIIELHDWLLPGRGTSRGFLRAVAEAERDFVSLGENILSIRHRL